MPLSKSAGYNLLELLIVLAVVAIITNLALPSFAQFQLQQQRSSSVQQLKKLLFYSRAKAATTRNTVTFCLSNDALTCHRDAKNFLLVFADLDDDQYVDSGELLIQEQPSTSGTLYRLRASNRHTIRYKPTGRVMDYGHIIICPNTTADQFAARLIISPSGRTRHGRDKDGDGIVETSDGMPIDCSAL